MKFRSLLFLLLFLPVCLPAQNPAVVVASYYNAADPRDEWTTVFVMGDNVNLNNWTLGDNNSAQASWQTAITFNNPTFWNGIRSGTIIVIWHRQFGTDGSQHPKDIGKQDGYMELWANDPAYFSGGSFGTAPLFSGSTLNIAAGGDLLELINPSGVFIHALGHKATPGPSWSGLPATPKLNHHAGITDGQSVFICPGSTIDEYGNLPPQDGTTYTALGTSSQKGLPGGCLNGGALEYWRNTREVPSNPLNVTAVVNPGNTQVVLSWSAVPDYNPSDGVIGYMINRCPESPNYSTLLDGHTYAVGERVQGSLHDTVIALIPNSTTTTYTDNISIPCGTSMHYRVMAYRFSTDEQNGNDYHLARGQQWNEDANGLVSVSAPLPVAPVSVASDRNNFCEDDPGNIILTATGGTGSVLQWFAGSCGGTPVGTGSPLTIASPSATTTYYARWENSCGSTGCQSVTVTVLPQQIVGVTITADQNPVCTGTSVLFTAFPVGPGTAPVYQWKVNGSNVGSNSPTYSYVPADGDIVSVEMTSSAACPSSATVVSNSIVMSVSASVAVSATNSCSPGDTVCSSTPVTFSVLVNNGGTNPTYQWFKNGLPSGNSTTFTLASPANDDKIWCRVTSSSSCASNNPANSDTITMTVMSALQPGVSVSASPGDTICPGTEVTFTSMPSNGGSAPVYQWFINDIPVGTNNPEFITYPSGGDRIWCRMTSDLSCAVNNPVFSDTITINISLQFDVSVSILANTNDTICEGTLVTMHANAINCGNLPGYQWYKNGSLVGYGTEDYTTTPSEGDIFWCIVTSDLSCVSNNPAWSDSLTFHISGELVAGVSVYVNPGDTVCTGTPVLFTAIPANGGINPQFQWYLNGNPSGTNNDTYTLIPADGDAVYCKMTSDFSCATGNPAFSDTLLIAVSSGFTPEVTISADKDSVCPGNIVVVTAAPVFGGTDPLFEWFVNSSSVQTGVSNVYSDTLSAGDTIFCRMTSTLACVTTIFAESSPVVLAAAVPPSIQLSDKDYLCSGSTITLDAGSGFAEYLWQDGSTGRYLDVSDDGVYSVTVTDSSGCMASDSVILQPCDSAYFYIPSAFSPNNDGLNDVFLVVSSGEGVTSFSMIIFDRWGQIIFTSYDIENGWYGTFNGANVPGGTYAWKIQYSEKGISKMLKGTVMVVR